MKVSVEFEPTIRQLAEAFCLLNDEMQAQFFIEASAIASTWPKGFGGPSYQWHLIGKHLKECECSTYDAQDMVRDIASGMGEQ